MLRCSYKAKATLFILNPVTRLSIWYTSSPRHHNTKALFYNGFDSSLGTLEYCLLRTHDKARKLSLLFAKQASYFPPSPKPNWGVLGQKSIALAVMKHRCIDLFYLLFTNILTLDKIKILTLEFAKCLHIGFFMDPLAITLHRSV